MTRVMVRYKVKPEQVARNEELVRAVYEELHRVEPARAALRDVQAARRRHVRPPGRPDGEGSPLTGLDAFKAFQAGLRERCDEPPVVSELSEVGSFAW